MEFERKGFRLPSCLLIMSIIVLLLRAFAVAALRCLLVDDIMSIDDNAKTKTLNADEFFCGLPRGNIQTNGKFSNNN